MCRLSPWSYLFELLLNYANVTTWLKMLRLLVLTVNTYFCLRKEKEKLFYFIFRLFRTVDSTCSQLLFPEVDLELAVDWNQFSECGWRTSFTYQADGLALQYMTIQLASFNLQFHPSHSFFILNRCKCA